MSCDVLPSSTSASPEVEEGFATAGELRVHYFAAGSGPPLILLHGGGPGATGMGTFRRNLMPLASSFRTFVIDLPRFGLSDKPVVTGGLLAFNARVINDFMDALQIPKASFVGHSMGGGTAAKLAIDLPDRVDSLVLMGASGHGPSLFVPRPTEGIRRTRDYYREPTRERMRAILETFLADPAAVTADLLDERFENSMRPDVLEMKNLAAAPHSEDLTEHLESIVARTLLIWGREERVVPIDHALLLLRNIPDAILVVVPNCGHWVHYENPTFFNDVVTRFVRAVPGAA